MKKIVFFFTLLLTLNAYSQVVDVFNYTGALNANGWSTHSGTAAQFQALTTPGDVGNSLSFSGLAASTGNRTSLIAGNGEDINKALTGISGTGYYSFLMKVPNTTGMAAAGDYFTGFGLTTGASLTVFAPRVFVKPGSVAGTFKLGIQNTTGGTPTQTYTLVDYPCGTTVLVVIKLVTTTSPIQASLFVNPTPGQLEPASTISNSSGTATFTSFSSIFFRQAGTLTSGTGSIEIDEIRAGTTWGSVTPCNTPSTWYADVDGDGFGNALSTTLSCFQPLNYVANSTDCNDNSAAINPNTIWYMDMDNDGFGTNGMTTTACVQPIGYVANNTDCNDNNAAVNAVTTWYQDLDNDGFGNLAVTISNCGPSTGYVANSTDCNDNNAAVNPNAVEIYDLIDNNCNGQINEGFTLQTYYLDNDLDGFGGTTTVSAVTSPGANYVLVGGDCNDASAAIYPTAVEICDNLDNNCNGQIDETLTFLTYYQDLDNDGYGNLLIHQTSCSALVGYALDSTDCNDNNAAANSLTNLYEDLDNDGFGNLAVMVSNCGPIAGYVANNTDCNDANASIHPGALDIPINGIDEDCSGQDAPLLPIVLGLYEFTGIAACPVVANTVTTQPLNAIFSIFTNLTENSF